MCVCRVRVSKDMSEQSVKELGNLRTFYGNVSVNCKCDGFKGPANELVLMSMTTF